MNSNMPLCPYLLRIREEGRREPFVFHCFPSLLLCLTVLSLSVCLSLSSSLPPSDTRAHLLFLCVRSVSLVLLVSLFSPAVSSSSVVFVTLARPVLSLCLSPLHPPLSVSTAINGMKRDPLARESLGVRGSLSRFLSFFRPLSLSAVTEG